MANRAIIRDSAKAILFNTLSSGKKEITSTEETDVKGKATAQVVDANLVAGNIKKDVVILGVTGTYQA